jgi:sugar/nucleoside kinase (ribokinase family)
MPDESPRYDVTCAGIVVADVFSAPIDELPHAGMLTLVDRIYPSTGGCASNTGVSLVKLGARVGLIGKVGDDIFGEFIIRDMNEKGLDTSGITVSSRFSTSKTIIIPVKGEDRRFIHVIGANADLGYDDLDLAMIQSSRALYIGGFLLQPKMDQKAIARLFRFARERGIVTALDVIVPSDFRGNVEDSVAAVLPFTDIFLPNIDEATLLTGSADPLEQARIFNRSGCKVVVITMGEEGTLVIDGDQALRSASFGVDVVDPSGAGDAFDAGFIWGLLQGWELKRTLTFASALGASACLELGATPGVFTQDEIGKFLEDNRLSIEVLS